MVFTSQYEEQDIPDVDLFSYQFDRPHKPFPDDKEIYVDPDTGRTYTWIQAKTTAIEFGKGLRSQWGLQKGDVLGFFSPNTIDYAPAFFGVLWAGGAVSTANPNYTLKELTFQMKDSNVKGIVTQLPYLKTAVEAANAIGLPDDRVILMGDARDPKFRFRHFTDIRNTSIVPGRYGQVRVDPSRDLAFLVYSSGTTGLPKGVMITHRNIIANVCQQIPLAYRNGLNHAGGPDGKGDKQLAVLPFFHVYGLTCISLEALRAGLQIVVLPKFDMGRFCQIVQEHGITYACIPPPIVLALAKHPDVDRYDLSSLKWMNSGGAPLGQTLVNQVWDRLKIPILQGYGLSEVASTLTRAVVADWAKYNGSCGKLLPNIIAKIVDPEGKELGPGEEGELWVKGPNVFRGYLNRPELKESTFSKCGFFRTGDIAYVDTKGNYYITDRLKELIKYKAFQVAPAELEALLLGHPDIADACVIPAHDKQRETEVPRAYLVMKPTAAGTSSPPSSSSSSEAEAAEAAEAKEKKATEIMEWVKERVANHKQLRGGVRFVGSIPKNASGKLLRRVLKEEARREDKAAGGDGRAKL